MINVRKLNDDCFILWHDKKNEVVFLDIGGFKPQYIMGVVTADNTIILKNAADIDNMMSRYAEDVQQWRENYSNWDIFEKVECEVIDLKIKDSTIGSYERGDQTPPFERNAILADGSTERGPVTMTDYNEQVRLAHQIALATKQEKQWIKRTANEMEKYHVTNGSWVCEVCLQQNFQGTRECLVAKCLGRNHHVRQQREHERNLARIKSNNDLPIAAHFARLVGLICEDEVTRSYGDEGRRLAVTIDPDTIPGAESYPEEVVRPVVVQKRDLEGRNNIKGNATIDAKWNMCAKNARRKWRLRMKDDTVNCVHRFHNDLGNSERNDRRPWKEAMAKQWGLKEFIEQDAMEFDDICNEADAVKDAAEDDPYRQSRKKLRQAFGDHHVILASDAFKGTGFQANKCLEFGTIVAQQRVLRGKSASDNSTDPKVREILGPRKEFKYRAPTRQITETTDSGGASGSNDRADQTAQSKGKGPENKRKAEHAQDKGQGKRFRVPPPTNDEIRNRMSFAVIDRVNLDEIYTQTWADANSMENAIGAPDGSKPTWRYFALLDPKQPWVTSARTLSTSYLRYPERGRSRSMICFGMDKNLLVASFCSCIQGQWGTKNIMLSYYMLKWQQRNEKPLRCIMRLEFIGHYSPQTGRHTYFAHCEICMDTLCQKCSEETVRSPHKCIKNMIKDPKVSEAENPEH